MSRTLRLITNATIFFEPMPPKDANFARGRFCMFVNQGYPMPYPNEEEHDQRPIVYAYPLSRRNIGRRKIVMVD